MSGHSASPVPGERVDRLIVISTTLVVLAEVVINFITSYQHIYDLGMKYGEVGVDARLLPVGIDLMLLAFAEVNLFLSRRGRKSFWMRLGLGVGVFGTVAANAAYGAHWGQTGGLLAFWSPLALFATVEAGMMLLRVSAEGTPLKPSPSILEPSGAIPVSVAEETRPEVVQEDVQPDPEPAPKAPAPPLNTDAWRGLNGIGLR